MYSLHILILQLNKLKNIVKSICYNLSSAVSTVTELDKDGDGTPDIRIEKIDGKHEGASNTRTYTDTDDDGTFDTVSIVNKNHIVVEGTNILNGNYHYEGNIEYQNDGTKMLHGGYKNKSGETISHVDLLENADNQIIKKINYLDETHNQKLTTVNFKYDSEGNVIYKGNDINSDGYDDFVVRSEFPDENTTLTYYDFPLNGEKSNRYEFTNNHDNTATLKISANNNEDINFVVHYKYDDNGQQIERVMENGSGKAISTLKSYYDDDGKVIRTETDRGSDNSVDAVNTYYYKDGDSHYYLEKIDSDNKNGNDKSIRYVYDNEHRKIEAHHNYDLENSSNDNRYIEYFEYNDVNRITERYKIMDGSTEKTDIICYGYSKGENGGTITRASVVARGDSEHLDVMTLNGKNYELGSDFDTSHIDMTGLKNIYINKDNVQITISDDILDKIATDDNSHKVIVNSKKSGDQLHLDGNFTKTAETESHGGQDYVKYTDEVGNALIVDPDITVDII
ncbi:hypothetical protein [Phocoenobacter atlanticus]|uniref:hypothetical protein n=1 Tax=Phocoenobacter atlanticus TaxID=3416742 RepID=UPI00276D106C|nr:hypothetical protein [Pasteurella atlantica]MDP8102039.1 hypothetical protein [Pasteurella atlantica]